MTFNVPAPELQIDFALNLAETRERLLQDALSRTMRGLKIQDVDKQLAELVPAH